MTLNLKSKFWDLIDQQKIFDVHYRIYFVNTRHLSTHLVTMKGHWISNWLKRIMTIDHVLSAIESFRIGTPTK